MKKSQSAFIYFILFLIFLFISVLVSSVQNFSDSQSGAFVMWLVGTPVFLHLVTLTPLVLAIVMKKKN